MEALELVTARDDHIMICSPLNPYTKKKMQSGESACPHKECTRIVTNIDQIEYKLAVL